MPTTQPAVREVPIITGMPATHTRNEGAADPYVEAANPVLLQASPFAVVVPEAERIEVNDFVTIIVREVKSSSSDSKLESEKEWTLEAALKKWFRLDKDDHLVAQTFPNGNPGANFEFKNEYEGEGKIDRKDALTMRITAKVIDVKPNGVLTLEAANQVKIDEETYAATLTGQCRSKDVTAQNTVMSSQLYGLEIDVQHAGAARDAARRGWLMRLFDFLRPL
jgi:flagellar L-ring protein precursor FlgH